MDANHPLPAGWIAQQDPSSGRTFYANTVTGQTQWEQPQPTHTPPRTPPHAQGLQLHASRLASDSLASQLSAPSEGSSASEPGSAVYHAPVGAALPILAADEVTKLSPAKQRDKLRYLGARDLVQAEETHVSRLRCLLEHFRDPIQVQKILTREEIKVPSASFMMCDPC